MWNAVLNKECDVYWNYEIVQDYDGENVMPVYSLMDIVTN